MAAVCLPSEGMRLCIRMVRSDWVCCLPAWTALGYGAFGLVCILPLFNTFLHAGKLKSVGRGTRVEPFVASLLGYGCSLLLSLMSKWEVNESVWINGIGVSVNFIYLVLFLICAEHTGGWISLAIPILGATVYLGLTMVVGLLFESMVIVKWLCMLSGLASSCAPLILAWFVVGRYLENLPDWFSSTVGLLYYIVWATFPEQDRLDVIPNAMGVICSVGFFVLLFRWRNQHEPAAGPEEEPLLDEQNEPLIEVQHEPAAGPEEEPLLDEQNEPLIEVQHHVINMNQVHAGAIQLGMDPEEAAAAGALEENPAGLQQQQVHNPAGQQLPQVVDPAGQQLPQVVDPAGQQLPQVVDPAGQQLPQVDDPAGQQLPQVGPLEENPAGLQQAHLDDPQDPADPQQPPVDPQDPADQ